VGETGVRGRVWPAGSQGFWIVLRQPDAAASCNAMAISLGVIAIASMQAVRSIGNKKT